MKLFETTKQESPQTWLKRLAFNLFPAYRATGAWICFLSSDWREVHVKLSLKWSTRNYVGTVFGGSLYGAVDPVYMAQLINILGDDYVVWDKSATIKFVRPVKHTVMAGFRISDELVQEIKNEVSKHKEYVFELPAEFRDKVGNTYVQVTKQLYVADKDYYKQKRLGA
jgi:acyl-coenzyme A thioesterase PaaI-like protein